MTSVSCHTEPVFDARDVTKFKLQHSPLNLQALSLYESRLKAGDVVMVEYTVTSDVVTGPRSLRYNLLAVFVLYVS